jgi:hypothetical protein
MLFRGPQKPDLDTWHAEGRGVYVRNDGLARVEKVNFQWLPSVRLSVDDPWQPCDPGCGGYGTLHVAQWVCRHRLEKLVTP